MRDDFNKQLTERERIGHSAKFHDVRGGKLNSIFDEDARGGTVSIHNARRNSKKVNRKSFNENLNPLRNFLRVNVGRPWNKVFSELNKAFDRRKVVNNHIFEHLFQYVEIQAKVIDGKVCVLNSYRNYRPYDSATGKYGEVEEGYYDKRWTPIKEDSCEWYVHPVDGLLKSNEKNRVSRKARREANEKARAAQLDKVFKIVDADNHLYLEDGVWKLYTVKDKPPAVQKLFAPHTMTEWQFRILPKDKRQEVGVLKWVHPEVHQLYPPNVGYARNQIPSNRYYATCQTAGRKLLKQFDLVGTAVFDEDAGGKSHREMSKYRLAA